MHDLTFTGVAGEIRYGYHLAARLGEWSVANRVFTATITQVVNALWLSQSSLTLVIPRPEGRPSWVRDLEGLQIAGRVLTARVVPTVRAHADVAAGNNEAGSQ